MTYFRIQIRHNSIHVTLLLLHITKSYSILFIKQER